jgi:beta-lactam-binding protein with PASTA domain
VALAAVASACSPTPRLADVIPGSDALPAVPDVEGLKHPEALRSLDESGLAGHVVKSRVTASRWNRVIAQDPAPGVTVLPGSTVELTLSKPPPSVPEVDLLRVGAAVRRLQSRGYRVRKLFRFEDFWSAGTVIGQRGPNRALPGEIITLVIAKERIEPDCTPGYSPCLPPASDYDCVGGTGDGPEYTGTVHVTGIDIYELDDDGDGVGCD